MRSAQDIIQHHSNEDGSIDLEAVIKKLRKGMDGKMASITPQDILAMQEAHLAWAIQYLGNLVLDVAEETGTLPKGKEAEMQNLMLALSFDKTVRMYETVRHKRERKLHLPGDSA